MSLAAAEARMGASLRKCLANASASFDGGASIRGTYSDRPAIAPVGLMTMQVREFQFVCATTDCGDIDEGAQVALTPDAGTQMAFNVAEATVDTHLGNTSFVLTKGV